MRRERLALSSSARTAAQRSPPGSRPSPPGAPPRYSRVPRGSGIGASRGRDLHNAPLHSGQPYPARVPMASMSSIFPSSAPVSRRSTLSSSPAPAVPALPPRRAGSAGSDRGEREDVRIARDRDRVLGMLGNSASAGSCTTTAPRAPIAASPAAPSSRAPVRITRSLRPESSSARSGRGDRWAGPVAVLARSGDDAGPGRPRPQSWALYVAAAHRHMLSRATGSASSPDRARTATARHRSPLPLRRARALRPRDRSDPDGRPRRRRGRAWPRSERAAGRCGAGPADALFPSMPEHAIAGRARSAVLPLSAIAPLLSRLCAEEAPAAAGAGEDESVLRRETGADEGKMEDIDAMGTRAGYGCPRVQRRVVGDRRHPRRSDSAAAWTRLYRGGAPGGKDDSLEGSLWAAVRGVEESANLSRRMSERLERSPSLAARFKTRSAHAIEQASSLRKLLRRRRGRRVARSVCRTHSRSRVAWSEVLTMM